MLGWLNWKGCDDDITFGTFLAWMTGAALLIAAALAVISDMKVREIKRVKGQNVSHLAALRIMADEGRLKKEVEFEAQKRVH